jgi:hypothetical protein
VVMIPVSRITSPEEKSSEVPCLCIVAPFRTAEEDSALYACRHLYLFVRIE